MVNEIWQGDVLELAKRLPDNSIHMICTSPPYWGLRDYGTATWVGGSEECNHEPDDEWIIKSFFGESSNQKLVDGSPKITTQRNAAKAIWYKQTPGKCPRCGATRIDQQLGLEKTPEEFIEKMVLIFRELRRALRPDGSLWLNLGDSYASGGKSSDEKVTDYFANKRSQDSRRAPVPTNLKPKDLCGIPWRVALALQSDGWYLRSDIIWSKPNPMPESVTDRPTKAHEYIFLLTKEARYFYDAEAVREQAKPESAKRYEYEFMNGPKHISGGYSTNGQTHTAGMKDFNGNRNRRTVWEIATQPYPEAHFATYPEALVEPCILAGTSAKGVCGECGSPWQRIIEKQANYEKRQYRGEPNGKTPMVDSSGWRPSTILSDSWQPTCAHNTEPQPAIVLDPFMGSGTTASVAKRLGRNFLGFELNPDYIKLAWTRINNTQPPLIVEDNIVVAQYNVPEQLSF